MKASEKERESTISIERLVITIRLSADSLIVSAGSLIVEKNTIRRTTALTKK